MPNNTPSNTSRVNSFERLLLAPFKWETTPTKRGTEEEPPPPRMGRAGVRSAAVMKTTTILKRREVRC